MCRLLCRFLVCTAFVYAGYIFCGCLVFAPYHSKFRKLSTTSETLFSLLNGDDMFATFSNLKTECSLINFYFRIYLYTFSLLFIYVILSLFIAIITDTYELIKSYYDKGFPQSRYCEFWELCYETFFFGKTKKLLVRVAKFYKNGHQSYDPFTTDFYDGRRPGVCYLTWSWVMRKVYGPNWRENYQKATDRQTLLVYE